MCGLRCLVVCVLAFGVSVCGDLWAQSASALWPDLTSPAATTGGGEKDAALIVAVGDYAFVPDIPGAEDNALAWSLYLSKTRGVPWVKVLVNQQGTREKVWKHLEQAARAVQPGGTLWFVFIGHGAPSRDGTDGMLVGVDAQQDVEGLYARSLSRSSVLGRLQSGAAGRVVAVLDTCFSGQTAQGALIEGLQPLVPVLGDSKRSRSLIVFTASDANQFAGPLPHARRPAFSYLLLGALRGWGDTDGDGVVTVSEGWGYTRGALDRLLVGRSQSPQLWSGDPDVPLVRGGDLERGPDLQRIAMHRARIERDRREVDLGERSSDWRVNEADEVIIGFDSRPQGATVLLDGRLICKETPCQKAIVPGKHRVEMQHERYFPVRREIVIAEGDEISWALSPTFGRVSVVTEPAGLTVRIDGEEVGTTPGVFEVEPGWRDMTVDSNCHLLEGKRFEIDAGKTRTFDFTMRARESALKVTALDPSGNDLRADIYVDDEPMGTTPKTFKVPLCSEKLDVIAEGFRDYTESLALQEQNLTEVTASFSAAPNARQSHRSGARQTTQKVEKEAEKKRSPPVERGLLFNLGLEGYGLTGGTDKGGLSFTSELYVRWDWLRIGGFFKGLLIFNKDAPEFPCSGDNPEFVDTQCDESDTYSGDEDTYFAPISGGLVGLKLGSTLYVDGLIGGMSGSERCVLWDEVGDCIGRQRLGGGFVGGVRVGGIGADLFRISGDAIVTPHGVLLGVSLSVDLIFARFK